MRNRWSENAMILIPAKHGGFLVKEFSPLEYMHELLFCGNLDECLSFMRVRAISFATSNPITNPDKKEKDSE